MNPGNIKEALIIGAGVSGLATAKCLQEKGIKCTILDRNPELGGVWADGYYDFGVQVQKDLYEFPDFPLSESASPFTPGPEFQKYLRDYCAHYDITDRLRLGTRVTSVRQSGEVWEVDTDQNGLSKTRTADLLVIATGLYSEQPHMPVIEGQDGFSGEILHSSQVKTLDVLKGKRVAVVGYGKSATDIAGSATDVADKVHLVFRTAHWPVPRNLLGLLPFKWGMLTRLVAALIPPYVRPTPMVRALHNVGYPLPWLFWRVVEVLLRTQQGLGMRISNGKNLVPDHPVELDAFSEVTMVPRPGLLKKIRSGGISAHRSAIARFDSNKLVLADGEALDVDCVVFGTGWRTGLDQLPDDLRTRLGEGTDGIYLYRHILHPDVPNLAFVGRASSFMSVTTFALQARWLAEVAAGNVELPSSQAMQGAIDGLRRWKQSWMPDGPARSATLLLYMAHYHDELLNDLGHDPLRKTGLFAPLKELLVPYCAQDYRDVT